MSKEEKVAEWYEAGRKYLEQGLTAEAKECFGKIQIADGDALEGILALVRICFEEEHSLQEALWILKDSIERCKRNRSFILYHCKIIQLIRLAGMGSYVEEETRILKEIKKFCLENPKEENAKAMLAGMFEALQERDLAFFYKLEEIYLILNPKQGEKDEEYQGLKEWAYLNERNDIHEVVYLWMNGLGTKESRSQVVGLILKEWKKITSSLEQIKRHAPHFYHNNYEIKQFFQWMELKKQAVAECQLLLKDSMISTEAKKMALVLVMDGVLRYKDVQADYELEESRLFRKESRQKVQDTFKRMGEAYPQCYHFFSERYFEGRTVEELLGNPKAFKIRTLIFPIIGVVGVLCILIGLAYFLPKVHEKASISQEEKYQKNHDWWLTEQEIEQLYEIQEQRDLKMDLTVRYIQYEGEKEEYIGEGDYAYLVLNKDLYGVECNFYSNYFSEEELNFIKEEIKELMQGKDSDYTKCMKYFEIIEAHLKE